MERNIVKKYSNDEITVVWEPKKCIHAAVCVKMLPKVYDPKAKPWIKIDNASTTQLKEQISECPSGALSYLINGKTKPEPSQPETIVEVKSNGPLLVFGSLKVSDGAGKIELKNKTTAFCRCGASNNKPYCDGTHLKIEFKG